MFPVLQYSILGGILRKDAKTLAYISEPKQFLSYMEFRSMELARQLFDGEVNAVAAVGLGKIRIGGMIAQIDNINRILDRVALYLA